MAATSESTDRITRIHVKGLRSLDDVALDLDGLTVLIGDNGSGKSSMLEALEALRYFSEPGASVAGFFEQHPWPIRGGHGKLTIGVEAAGDDQNSVALRYEFTLVHNERGRIGVAAEQLLVGPLPGDNDPLVAFRRDFDSASVFDQGQRKLVRVEASPDHLLLSQLVNEPVREGQAEPQQLAVRRMGSLLRGIDVHVPFEAMAAWAARRTGRKSASREPNMLQPTRRLDLLAANLGNAYHSLKNEHGKAHWDETMEHVQLGLGRDVDDVSAIADAAGGQHAISVRYRSGGVVPAVALSDGTLAYLAFVALARLPSQRSLLAFDEPELHMHPGLLVRVLSLFESMGRKCPVVLSTHSDRLLDALQSPANSIVLCSLDENRATRLVRPDAVMLAKWLKDYRGFGDIRATGFQDAVMPAREQRRD